MSKDKQGSAFCQGQLWIVVGRWANGTVFVYSGAHNTRREAIQHHTLALGKTWDACRKKGDRAVKASLTWVYHA